VGGVAAVVLAVVFGLAGVSKGRRPGRTATAFRGLGLPAAGALARVVPLAEVALGIVLVMRPRLGGVVALVALAGFSVVLAAALRRGVRVACGCFGGSGAQPVTVADLVRNALLAVPAAAALAVPGPVGVPGLPAAVAATAATVAGLVVVALVRLRATAGPLWAPLP